MESSGKKSERMIQLELLLMSHPEGMRRAEIARRLGVHRATVGRYIDELSTRVPIWEKEYRIGLELDQIQEFPHLGLLESINLYLALDYFAEHTGVKNPPAAAAVRKIAGFFNGSAPFLSRRLYGVADKIDDETKPESLTTIVLLEQLAEAWVAGKKVRITRNSGKKSEEVCSILNLEFSKSVDEAIPVTIVAKPAGQEQYALALNDIAMIEILLDDAERD